MSLPLTTRVAVAGDWPQWRHDAGRTAVTPDALPRDLHLHWALERSQPRTAWPASQDRLQFDAAYEPIVLGQRLFVPSMNSDSVTALDLGTGREVWRFYADGPVRFAPVGANGRVYFVSDDGFLYCLDAAKGAVLWKVRGGPDDRRVLGNDRLISMWPARGGPVLLDGKIYFAAGIWPFMGIFIHAVDATTGRIIWTNSGSGASWMLQPHSSPAFGGVAPQGYLAADEETLLVSGGRTVPAAFDRGTGRLLHYELAGKDGACEVAVADGCMFNGSNVIESRTGRDVQSFPWGVYAPGMALGIRNGSLCVAALPTRSREVINAIGEKVLQLEFSERQALPLALDIDRVFVKAGAVLYGSGPDSLLYGIDVSALPKVTTVWSSAVRGTPVSMLAAGDRLVVSTREGGIFCYGAGRRGSVTLGAGQAELPATDDDWARRASEISALAGSGGYAVVLGLASGRLAEELVLQKHFQVIVVDADPKRIEEFRRRMDACGLYGKRVTAFHANPFEFSLPPYMASLVFSERAEAAGLNMKQQAASAVLQCLRPYGGLAVLGFEAGRSSAAMEWGKAGQAQPGGVEWKDGSLHIRRIGPLAGAGSWTHQYADAGNTVVSRDTLVKPPLGLLWFGGPPNDPILPRHGHGPSPQVLDGRLFIEGTNLLRAVDVYTGRLLWESEIPGLGDYYNFTHHQPGADEIGSNYATTHDAIYVKRPDSCVALDPVTGRIKKTFVLPRTPGRRPPVWGFVTIWDDLLIAAVGPALISPEWKDVADEGGMHEDGSVGTAMPVQRDEAVDLDGPADYAAESRRLVVMDRHSGRILWSRAAALSFRHNAIVAGKGKVFCLDSISPAKLLYLQRSGYKPVDNPTLYALDARTGAVAWRKNDGVSGTWLGYSEEHDVLFRGGARGRDRARDEVNRGMTVFRGEDGKLMWSDSSLDYRGPCMLHHRTLYAQFSAFDLLSGKPLLNRHPLTGQSAPWTLRRMYGCNHLIAGEHLITFRSAAAGYFDLASGGTGNLGGFKSGCTSNLIPADGVLNAPDYTRTCVCSYQNQSSLAAIYMPDAEMWTFSPLAWDGTRVRKVGLNFGAPGDRVADDGTLWMDSPSVGGPSPDIPVTFTGTNVDYFRDHSLYYRGEKSWIGASGVMGMDRIQLQLSSNREDRVSHTLRFYFAEPDANALAGDRVFDVSVNQKPAISDWDIVREAGGSRKVVSRRISGLRLDAIVNIDFKPRKGRPLVCGVEVAID